MSFNPKVSLVVVSRDRPRELRRLLSALRFQLYEKFELIVISNSKLTEFLPETVETDSFKYVYFDEENISKARNVGIKNAAGEIVAFCDDDAIPEPTWLVNLIPPFKDAKVGISGGFVLGRNGISYQWKGLKTDHAGNDTSLEISEITIQGFKDNQILKAQGTNCAIRRSALYDIYGFDDRFEFFLDETDICFTLGKAGWLTAIVPLALVQHGYAASAGRSVTRAPKSLLKIGRSKNVFLEKHCKRNQIVDEKSKFISEQHARLNRYLIFGQLEPRDIPRLLNSLKEGLYSNIPKRVDMLKDTSQSFIIYNTYPVLMDLYYSRLKNKKKLFDEAKIQSKEGIPITAMCFSKTTLFHKRYFHDDGFWVQTGGIFGKSNRSEPYFLKSAVSLTSRVGEEMQKLRFQRKFKQKMRLIE